jgi:hypothetical protein
LSLGYYTLIVRLTLPPRTDTIPINMMGLWADGWFYISSAGLLVSGILFFFLLGQYRAASEAADVTEGDQGADKEISAVSAIRPVYIPEDVPAPKVASHSDKPEPKAEAKPKPDAEQKDPSVTTGGISPAVVYLQNIKGELTDLHNDLRSLSKRVDDELAAVSTRDEALIERLGDLTRAVESLKAGVPAVAAAPAETPAPAPKKARKAEKTPEPEIAVVLETKPEPAPEPVPEPKPEPVPEPKTEPARSPDETIRMELGALISPAPVQPETKTPVTEPVAEPVAVEPPPEEKPRRGPGWPV